MKKDELKKADGSLPAIMEVQLKTVEPDKFRQVLAALILRAMKLNLQDAPEVMILDEITSELYSLLRRTWKGVTPAQLKRTIDNGMAKQGGKYLRITYPVLANWFIYHRFLATEKSESEDFAPSLNEQAIDLLSGLADYRKRKEAENG